MAEKPKLSRRQMLTMTGKMGVAATVLAACGGTAQQTSQPAEGGGAPAQAAGTIDFLAWGDNADLPGWDALTKKYAEVNPNLKINVTTVADPGNNFYTKLQTAVAGGLPPTVARRWCARPEPWCDSFRTSASTTCAARPQSSSPPAISSTTRWPSGLPSRSACR